MTVFRGAVSEEPLAGSTPVSTLARGPPSPPPAATAAAPPAAAPTAPTKRPHDDDHPPADRKPHVSTTNFFQISTHTLYSTLFVW